MEKKAEDEQIEDNGLFYANLSAEDCNNRLAAAHYDMKGLATNGNNHPNVQGV